MRLLRWWGAAMAVAGAGLAGCSSGGSDASGPGEAAPFVGGVATGALTAEQTAALGEQMLLAKLSGDKGTFYALLAELRGTAVVTTSDRFAKAAEAAPVLGSA